MAAVGRQSQSAYMTLGEHLEALRQVLIRIAVAVVAAMAVVFCLKDATFRLLLAPHDAGFVTYRAVERLADALGMGFRFEPFHVDLIATELQSQFMTHLTASVTLGALVVSPYILYQLFTFVSPALYASERRYAVPLLTAMYVLFMAGVAMSYFVLFPVAFRFLATYQVSADVRSIITLDSYISTFATLTLVMGLVFQLPVVAYVLARLGLLDAELMSRYRRHAVVLVLLVSAIITPPDVFTLILVALPLYVLYEACIAIIRHTKK